MTRDTRAKIARTKRAAKNAKARAKRAHLLMKRRPRDGNGPIWPGEDMADFLGNLLLGSLLKKIGFRGRDFLSIAIKLVGLSQPSPATLPNESGTKSASSTKRARSNKNEKTSTHV